MCMAAYLTQTLSIECYIKTYTNFCLLTTLRVIWNSLFTDIEVYRTFSTIYYVHLFAVCQTINKILLLVLENSLCRPTLFANDARLQLTFSSNMELILKLHVNCVMLFILIF